MEYTDGFFNVSKKHGFLPMVEPLTSLPSKYEALQSILDRMSIYQPDGSQGYLAVPDRIEEVVQSSLPNFLSLVSKETDPIILQALFRAYTFLASAYTLEKSYQEFVRSGNYGKARRHLCSSIAEPLVAVSNKLDVYPWLDYHYAYSLGNYVKRNKSSDLHWSNLDMACKFTGLSDENGFIMIHVYINELSPSLVGSVMDYWQKPEDSLSLESVAKVMKYMNVRRREMWNASRPERYNDFRVFIMGIKGNEKIFDEGVIYENCFNNEPQQFRGQTGAQDNIIPTMDIFTGIVDYYPENELTKYLLDLRQYRPKCVQRFFEELRENFSRKPILQTLLEKGDVNGIVYLLQIVDEVYHFRNGHWQFVQKYIMSNTKYAFATGGTPITTWLLNQIECVLEYERVLISKVENLGVLSEKNKAIFLALQKSYNDKVALMQDQVKELKKVNYNIDFIYKKNSEFFLSDHLSFTGTAEK
jgi:indoleamine 2,3-dioxygenase